MRETKAPPTRKARLFRRSEPSHDGVSVRTLIGVSVLWLPLSMIFNSLQSIVLPVAVLRFVPAAGKATALGWAIFLGLAAGTLIQPLAGSVSDHIADKGRALGRRGPAILIGVLMAMVFLLGIAFASNIWALVFAYVGLSVAVGIAQAGSQGLMPDRIPARQRGSASGLKGLLELLGSVLGFAVAGMFLKHGNIPGVMGAIGVALIAGALLAWVLLLPESTSDVSRESSGRARGALQLPTVGPVSALAQQAAKHGRVRQQTNATLARTLLSRFLFLLGVYGVGHFLLFYVRDRLHIGASAAATTSGLFTLLTVVTAVVALSGGMLSDRFGRLPILWAAGAFSAAGVLILIPAASLPLIVTGGAVMSVGSGLFASANWALAADLAPAGQGGRFFGVVALATGGATAAAGLFGPLIDHGGYNTLFVVAALAFCISTVLLPRVAPAQDAQPMTGVLSV